MPNNMKEGDTRMKTTAWASMSLALMALCGGAAARESRASEVRFDIAPQPLALAVNAWAEQADLQVVWPGRQSAAERVSPRVEGDLPPEKALHLLLQGSGLTYTFVDDQTVALRSEAAGTTRLAGVGGESRQVTLADNRDARVDAAADEARPVDSGARSQAASDSESLAEIVVTGTHIRGARSSPSPVKIYNRDEIDRTGLGNVQEFIQRLPQNFNGGASEDTVGSVIGGGNSVNAVGATGINLRGLGNDATLVLINGHRVAAGNERGNFVDISLIPLNAVERIEVVTDGASAVYGTDAVGGVVNFILRRDFDGAETRARYGSVSEGGSRELQAAQSFGHTWSTGSAFLSYEYFDRTPLNARDREYTRTAVQPFDLVPDQNRHSAFVSFGQSVRPGFELLGDASFARRTASYRTGHPFFVQELAADIDALGATVGARVDLNPRMQIEVSGTYTDSESDTATLDLRSVPAGEPLSSDNTDTSIASFDAKISGDLWTLPTGPVRFAVGGQYRDESFDRFNKLARTHNKGDRTVTSGFVEVRIPIVGPKDAGSSRSRLELSLADRYESYNDFGDTNNPAIGAIWQPVPDIALRATYGKSFKAPLLYDLNAADNVYAIAQFDPTTGTDRNTLIVFGGNGALKAEKAKTLSFGIDLQPQVLPGFRVSANYYKIHFTNRIADPSLTSINTFDALRSEATLGPNIIVRDPSAALIQSYAPVPAANDYTGTPGGVDLASIAVIVDSRIQNLSDVNTSGVDLDLDYEWDAFSGRAGAGIDATYILTFDNHFTSTSPELDIRNTPYNPVDLRLRAHTQYSHGPVNVAAFVNYTDSYTDARGTTPLGVASWTTVDATVSYEFGLNGGGLSDTLMTLGITNLADKDPPFLTSPARWGLNYDGANANALGRMYSFQVSKRW